MAAHKPTARALVPAAVRAPEVLRLTDDEIVLNDQAIDVFVRAVGGRAKLTEVLSVVEMAPEVDKVVTLLLDVRYKAVGLRRLCTLAGVTVAELLAAYRKALITKAHIEASHVIASRLVPIVEDVMTRAMPTAIACDVCKGVGTVEETKTPCWKCQATGRILSEPDFDRQKLALELGQLLEKKGGLTITQNQGVVAAGALAVTGGGALEQLHQAVGDLLFTPGRTRAAAPHSQHAPVIEPPVEMPPPPLDDPLPDLPIGIGEPDDADDADTDDDPDDAR